MALSAVSYAVWWALDDILGRSLPAQLCSVGLGVASGLAVYGGSCCAAHPEAERISRLVRERLA